MTWNKNGLKLEVEGYKDDTKVNWSELARRYEIKNKKGEIAKNGGQIAQEWLISQGVNLHRFKRPSEAERQPRRKKLKGLGGEISIPTPEPNDALKQRLKLKIQQGEFTVGELIVPREVSMWWTVMRMTMMIKQKKEIYLPLNSGEITVKSYLTEETHVQYLYM